MAALNLEEIPDMDAQSSNLGKWTAWMMPRKKAATKASEESDKEPEIRIIKPPETPATPEDLGLVDKTEEKKKPKVINADEAFNKAYDAATETREKLAKPPPKLTEKEEKEVQEFIDKWEASLERKMKRKAAEDAKLAAEKEAGKVAEEEVKKVSWFDDDIEAFLFNASQDFESDFVATYYDEF